MGCYNFSVGQATTSFNVSMGGLYEITNTPINVTDCANLTVQYGSYNQIQNIVQVGGASCINITASNVTFNGNGYSIANYTYNGTGINIYANPSSIIRDRKS